MKIGMFSDPHYSSAEVTCGNRYNNKSLDKIKRALKHFADEKCELAVILGDVTDTEPAREMEIENLRKVSAAIRESRIHTICMMGNHDAFVIKPCEFYEIIGTEFCPRTLTVCEKNLVFLDACFYADGTHYMPGGSDWTDTFYPYTEKLKAELAALKGETYVFLHQNIDPDIREDHRLKNAAEMRGILENAGNVRGVFQGHYHWGHENDVNGIRYITLKAMCENDDAYYIFEI